MVLLTILPYILVFGKNGISQQSEDWANLGTYISGVLGIVSLILLYLTYREQRSTNHIEHFEKILYKHIDEIVRLQKNKKDAIDNFCNKFLNLFFYVGDYQYNKEYTKEEAEGAIVYAYTHFINIELNDNTIEDVFRYVEYTIEHIEYDTLIDAKEFYYLEIKNNLTTEMKVVLFIYLISENKLKVLNLLDKHHLFKDLNVDNDMFKFIVSMLCSTSGPTVQKCESHNSALSPDLFEINDNTTFNDIINHIKKIKSSSQ